MPKSAAFIRIRQEVLEVVHHVPSGRISTYADIGSALEVMPRHVAYILSQLSATEREAVPWHRVVSSGGLIPARTDRELQAALLRSEGVVVTERFSIDGSDELLVQVGRPSGGPG